MQSPNEQEKLSLQGSEEEEDRVNEDSLAPSPLAQPGEDDVERIQRLRQQGTAAECLQEALHWLNFYLASENADLESVSTALTLNERAYSLQTKMKEHLPLENFMLCLYNSQIQPEAREELVHAPGISLIDYHSIETPDFLTRILFNVSGKPETCIQALESHQVPLAALIAFRCIQTPFPRQGHIYRLTTTNGGTFLYFASFDLQWSQLIVEQASWKVEKQP